MRNKHNRHAPLVAQLSDHIKNLLLDGYIQCRCGLIGNQYFWIAAQRHRNHHSLPLTSGHLMWIVIHPRLRIGNTDLVEECDCLLASLCGRNFLMKHNRFDHLASRSKDRIERGHWLLKDHTDIATANLSHLAFRQSHHIATEKSNAAAFNFGTTGEQSHNRKGGD